MVISDEELRKRVHIVNSPLWSTHKWYAEFKSDGNSFTCVLPNRDLMRKQIGYGRQELSFPDGFLSMTPVEYVVSKGSDKNGLIGCGEAIGLRDFKRLANEILGKSPEAHFYVRASKRSV